MSTGRPLYDTGADRALYRRARRLGAAAARGRAAQQRARLRLPRGRQDQPAAPVGARAAHARARRLRSWTRAAWKSAAELAARLRAAAGDDAAPSGGRRRGAARCWPRSSGSAGRRRRRCWSTARAPRRPSIGLFGRQRDALWRLPHHYCRRGRRRRAPRGAQAARPTRSSTPCWRSSRCPTRRSSSCCGGAACRRSSTATRSARSPLSRAATRARRCGPPTARSSPASAPGSAASRRAELLSDARALGRPHGMLMSELLDLGQASPSDEALQSRLGLSRARITTLLRQLLEAGLVSNGTDRTDAPGRPKTMYRPGSRSGSERRAGPRDLRRGAVPAHPASRGCCPRIMCRSTTCSPPTAATSRGRCGG